MLKTVQAGKKLTLTKFLKEKFNYDKQNSFKKINPSVWQDSRQSYEDVFEIF